MRDTPGEQSALAANPLRPSAEGAEPTVATSDTLCRIVGATERSPNLTFAITDWLSPTRDNPRCQDPGGRHPVKGDAVPRAQDAFRRRDARPCGRVKPFAFPFTFARKSSHPCRPPRSALLVNLEARRAVLLRLISVRLATPLDPADKMLLTDLCNRPTTRAPVDRSTSGLLARAEDNRWIPPQPRPGSSTRRRTTLRQFDPGWVRA